MEVKNGIIIDGVLHELSKRENDCQEWLLCQGCSLCRECTHDFEILCDIFDADKDERFVNRGKVTDIKIDKEE